MKEKTVKFINDLANEIREENNIEIPIKDMRIVAETLGGRVKTKNTFVEEDWSSGNVKKVNKDSFVIKVDNLFFEKEREDFTIACELGHLYLHMGYQVLPDLWKKQPEGEYICFDKDEQKYQAYEFAHAFLMPEKEYIKVINENIEEDGRINIKNVAKYFNVSVPAATNRGKRLGMVEW